ncbi:uncharacterized protein IUM83_13184 [Phytophthora cinnamomi]|uniref:uncharacterized protein n=1 Tax=Phytophthora cinnamomi TaxID=4785 RepID=UPI00355A1499|nr:hypothetical protein IUM83_13184 [Phytophthora cinnamomi]
MLSARGAAQLVARHRHVASVFNLALQIGSAAHTSRRAVSTSKRLLLRRPDAASSSHDDDMRSRYMYADPSSDGYFYERLVASTRLTRTTRGPEFGCLNVFSLVSKFAKRETPLASSRHKSASGLS